MTNRSKTMDGLLNVLREHAAVLEDFATPQDAGWDVTSNASSTRVNARTKALLPHPDDAWQAAKDLRDMILALGYALHGDCSIGVWSEIAEEPPGAEPFVLPITGWRGYVSLVIDTQ
jgi:hypothetical protein